MTDLDELPVSLTVTQAAQVLGISRGLAYQGVREGTIPALRIGGRIVVPRFALLEILHVPHETGARTLESASPVGGGRGVG